MLLIIFILSGTSVTFIHMQMKNKISGLSLHETLYYLFNDNELKNNFNRIPSVPCEPWSRPIHMQKVKVKGHSDEKIKWKQMDGQMVGADSITSRANVVGNHAHCKHRS